jgi:hypothetical protein
MTDAPYETMVSANVDTTRRPRPAVETSAFAAFAARILRSLRQRTCAGDIEGLAALGALARDLDGYTHDAVSALRGEPWCLSWTEIAHELGITRQAAHRRFHKAGGIRARGGQPARLR